MVEQKLVDGSYDVVGSAGHNINLDNPQKLGELVNRYNSELEGKHKDQ